MTGVVMMAVTAVLFSCMALFVRLAAEEIPVGMIVFVRYVLSTAFVVLLALSGKFPVKPVNMPLQLLRGITAALGAVFYFYALAKITIAEAVILKYTYPVFAVVFAAVFYREKTDRSVLLLIATSIIGVAIMMNPSALTPNVGYVFGFLNGFTAGAAVAVLRKLRETDDSNTTMFFTSLIGMIVTLPLLLRDMVMPSPMGFVLLILAAVAGIAAQFSLVFGFKYIKTGSASVVMALEVVGTSMLGFIVLGHTPGVSTLIGGTLIVAGGVLLAAKERRAAVLAG